MLSSAFRMHLLLSKLLGSYYRYVVLFQYVCAITSLEYLYTETAR